MFLIRDACAADLEGLHDVAVFLDSVNLPADRTRLRDLIERSERSFAGRCDVAERRYLFVLTDPDSDAASGPSAILGASMIFAQHGSRRSPHVYFDVIEEERYSETLDRHVVHRVLRIGYNYKGVTEIGGLVLHPNARGHREQLGRLLSYARFMYLALHRTLFRDEVLSELMPPLEPDRTSLLWEALGRKFTGLSYQEADRLSHENKEFIRTLFPEEPIYATLLPASVQAVIGQVGPQTKSVERMLTQIGFTYANRIDPFDGGPHFHARLDQIAPVRETARARVRVNDQTTVEEPTRRYLVVAESDDPTSASRFRAIAVPGIVQVNASVNVLLLSAEALQRLDLREDAEVAYLALT